MAATRYPTAKNPFEEDEEDIDDETFLRNSRRQNYPPTVEQQLQSLQEQKRIIEDRTLRSAERSIGILRESEQVGVATAEELSRQREKLEKTDKQLDEINQTLRFSQKHINGIKSVFGSLKNYMSGRNEVRAPAASAASSNGTKKESNTSLDETLASYDRYENHPSTRLRQAGETQSRTSASKDFTSRLDENLLEMQQNITRLKGLAVDLNVEIDSQNDLITNITNKTETADLMMSKQNKEMQKILK